MKDNKIALIPLVVMTLALCLGAACDHSQELSRTNPGAPGATASISPTQNQAQAAQSDVEKQRKEAEQQARPDIEKQRKEAEQRAEKTLDKEAIAAIAETQKAVAAIAGNKNDEAIAAIERATGKINILLARNPTTALIPVVSEVEVIDAAPLDIKDIKEHAKAAEKAVGNKDYPTARVLLHGLTSEIHTRTYNLPLATYPEAMKEAARLLDQKKGREANVVLLAALNTLVAVDLVNPIPLVVAQTAINDAQNLRDKDGAQRLLEVAKNELDRAKELGYSGNDAEYIALNKAVSDIETQLKGNGDTASAFSKLKEKVAVFFKRQSESERHS